MKRQRVKPGDILKVKIDEETHTYARILTDACEAYYDCRTTKDIDDFEQIIASDILFKITVDYKVLTSGTWPKVGHVPLEEHLKRNPLKYIKDVTNENNFSIYDNGEIRPATREECIGLEIVASWTKEHVEERLQCHYEGKTSWLMDNYGPLR